MRMDVLKHSVERNTNTSANPTKLVLASNQQHTCMRTPSSSHFSRSQPCLDGHMEKSPPPLFSYLHRDLWLKPLTLKPP